MKNNDRPITFWILMFFLALSIILMLLGKTMSVFNYDFTVRHGLQESHEQVGEYGVQINRAFGAGDTLVFVPLLLASFIGLWLKKRWSLISIAAAAGFSAYWSVTILFVFYFLPGTPGYNYVPGFEIWLFVITYTVFGIWSFFYILWRGEVLIQ